MISLATILATSIAAGPYGVKTFDLDFEGGSVGQWVQAIKAQAPDANIYIASGLGSDGVQVGPMHFKGVTVENVLAVCNRIPGSPIEADEIDGAGAPIWVVTASTPASARASQRTTSRGGQARNRSTSSSNSMRTGIYVIPDGYKSGQGPARVVQMLAGVTAMGDDQPIDIRMIAGTNLLAVRGSAVQRETVSELLDYLNREDPVGEVTVLGAASDANAQKRRALRARIKEITAAKATAKTEEEQAALKAEFDASFTALRKLSDGSQTPE